MSRLQAAGTVSTVTQEDAYDMHTNINSREVNQDFLTVKQRCQAKPYDGIAAKVKQSRKLKEKIGWIAVLISLSHNMCPYPDQCHLDTSSSHICDKTVGDEDIDNSIGFMSKSLKR